MGSSTQIEFLTLPSYSSCNEQPKDTICVKFLLKPTSFFKLLLLVFIPIGLLLSCVGVIGVFFRPFRLEASE
ncbi:hypothetical protein MRB53_026204 [Persea americana]|uniref:Uncharacterized protein n=1 Tax=Persea americana TaxID=3435 RepID=A0ACC2LI66_PERAE|nr:hypothetical protein MRB53_026204 [Persea americana]